MKLLRVVINDKPSHMLSQNLLKNGNIDIESISNSMLLLSSDSNLRKEMGANALERCKKYFDTKTTIEKTADIYFKSIK